MSKDNEKKSNNSSGAAASSKPRTVYAVIILILVLLGITVSLITGLTRPYDRTKNTYTSIEVHEGDSIDNVAHTLEEEGIIANATTFATLAKITLSPKFRPGRYYLSPSMSSVAIARTMANGITSADGFSIPAGYNLEQIASVLERDGIADKKKFLEAAASEDLKQLDIIGENKLGSNQVEGFLFPHKYSIDSDADESMLIMTMLNQFSNFFNDDYKARADELGLSIREIVYIASMIELETSVDKERAGISSVIHNRYNLELIPKNEFKKAPLCSPGPESIIAALYPEDNDNIYYVYSSKLDGTHVFTTDEKEYENLLREYHESMEAERS